MAHPESMNHLKIKLIVGLGNPGSIYKNTYHNAGLLALEWLVKNCGGTGSWEKVGDAFEYVKLKKLIWIRPLVYMNESGAAIAKAKKYFSAGGPLRRSASEASGSAFGGKILNENILTLHDDSDIEIGRFKLAFNKSSAGHKGVESTINALHTARFWRVRIGVRGQKNKKRALDFVLRKISQAHKRKFDEVFKKIRELSIINPC